MSTKFDLTGRKFGRLEVIEYWPERIGAERAWLCVCVCGELALVRAYLLKNGITTSSGCVRRETSAEIARSKKLPEGSRKITYRLWAWRNRREINEKSKLVLAHRRAELADSYLRDKLKRYLGPIRPSGAVIKAYREILLTKRIIKEIHGKRSSGR